ncbi:Mrp family chromosome partitioning ATPase [Bradyrhizobium ottawaense]
MYVLALVTQKGGSGKSTLAVGIAVAARGTGSASQLSRRIHKARFQNGKSGAAIPIPGSFGSRIPPK